MRHFEKEPFCFSALCALLLAYIGNRAAALYMSYPPDMIWIERLPQTVDYLWEAITTNPFFVSFDPGAIATGGICFLAVWLCYLYYLSNGKNLRPGEEHGSAVWGTKKDILPLMSEDPERNIPLSKTESISVDKVKNFEADRNKNIVVVGGSGSGKTYSEIKPSLMQLHSSYIITDPKGTILPDTGYLFTNNGYDVRSFNTIDFSKSLHYNPLSYIKKEADILKVVNVLIENTSAENNTGDKFWTDSERLLYTALIAYLWYEAPAADQNIPTMIDMLELCQVKEENEDYVSPVDILFEDLEAKSPNCLAVKQYKKFKQAAGKTMKSILISCASRLAPFDIDELREIMSYDELHLDEIGDRKTAFFVIMSDTDSSYAFLIAMIMYQSFNLLCTKADNEYNGTLPIPVRCLFDEFANIGKIPDFERLIATIRSRGISCMIILQSLSQISAVYKDNSETIIDNCDSLVFLGGKSTKTTEEIAKMIGKSTIDTRNINESRGSTGSWSTQNGTLGRDLIDPAEIGRLSRNECLVLITGLPPFRSLKYPTALHPRFKDIADGGAPLFDLRQEKEKTNAQITVKEKIDLSELNRFVKE